MNNLYTNKGIILFCQSLTQQMCNKQCEIVASPHKLELWVSCHHSHTDLKISSIDVAPLLTYHSTKSLQDIRDSENQ